MSAILLAWICIIPQNIALSEGLCRDILLGARSHLAAESWRISSEDPDLLFKASAQSTDPLKSLYARRRLIRLLITGEIQLGEAHLVDLERYVRTHTHELSLFMASPLEELVFISRIADPSQTRFDQLRVILTEHLPDDISANYWLAQTSSMVWMRISLDWREAQDPILRVSEIMQGRRRGSVYPGRFHP